MSSQSFAITRNRSYTFPPPIPFVQPLSEEYKLAERTLQQCQLRREVFTHFSKKFAASAYSCFQSDERKETVQSELASYSTQRQSMYPEYKPQRQLGYFVNRSYPVGSHILAHADLHGNIFATDALSEQIRVMGYYPHTTQENPWKGRLVTLFLGDMVNRGIKSWQTLRYALQFPEVEMIRGNHESVVSNLHTFPSSHGALRFMREDSGLYFLDPSEKLLDNRFLQTVHQFYSYLPLGAFISCSEKSPVQEHLMCTHGTFEPDMDVLDPLSRADSVFYLEREKPYEFSTRIQNILSLLPSSFHDPATHPDSVQDYLEGRLNSESDIKKIYAALALERFLDTPIEKSTSSTMRSILSTERKERGFLSVLNGRKIMPIPSCHRKKNNVFFSSELMESYYRLMSDEENVVAYHLRAHDHCEERKGSVYTLPASPEGAMVSHQGLNAGSEDVFVDMTITGPEVKLWDCRRWARRRGDSRYYDTGKISLKD